jgi:hypothetical protein
MMGTFAPVMNSTSPSLLAKILTATIGFSLMAAVPLLTMQYAVRAHAEAPAPQLASTSCPRACPVGSAACVSKPAACPTASCAEAGCAKY